MHDFLRMTTAQAEEIARRYADSRPAAVHRLRVRWQDAGRAPPRPTLEEVDGVLDWFEDAVMGGAPTDDLADLPVWWDEGVALPRQLPRAELPVTAPFVRLADEVGAWIERVLLTEVPSAYYAVARESPESGNATHHMPALLLSPTDRGTPGWNLAYITGLGPATRPSRYRRGLHTPWSVLLRRAIEESEARAVRRGET